MTSIGTYTVLVQRPSDEEPWLAYTGDSLFDAQSHMRFWGDTYAPENVVFFERKTNDT